MRPRRPLPPLWFLAVCAAAVLAVRLVGLDAGRAAPVSLAFFGFLIPIITAIWTGIQVAGQATLAALSWSVLTLWNFARMVYNGAKAVGVIAVQGLKGSWNFFRDVYENVLKPAWHKFWQVIDRVRDTLDRVFRPVFDVLRRIRDEFLRAYDRFVRPVLDTIGVARKVLRVFSALGLDWARRLDAKLGELEEKIDTPFRFLLRQINAVINLVNRIVTANGLFQRLALVRSIERDIRYMSRAFGNWRSRPLEDEDYERIRADSRVPTLDDIIANTSEAMTTGGGPYGPFIDETVAQWRIYLRR